MTVNVGQSISGNSEIRTSKNCQCLKSQTHTGKNCKVNFFRTLEVNQSLETIRGVFTQQKWLSSNKDSKFCGTLSSPTPIQISLDPQEP